MPVVARRGGCRGRNGRGAGLGGWAPAWVYTVPRAGGCIGASVSVPRADRPCSVHSYGRRGWRCAGRAGGRVKHPQPSRYAELCWRVLAPLAATRSCPETGNPITECDCSRRYATPDPPYLDRMDGDPGGPPGRLRHTKCGDLSHRAGLLSGMARSGIVPPAAGWGGLPITTGPTPRS